MALPAWVARVAAMVGWRRGDEVVVVPQGGHIRLMDGIVSSPGQAVASTDT